MLLPDHYAARLPDISLDALTAAGVTGMILDLDNTLVEYTEREPAREYQQWVAQAKERGLRLVMVSNNFSERVKHVGALLDIPTVHGALKPLPQGLLRALALLGTAKETTVVVGDQLFTDVLGAKLAGLQSILIEPLADRDFALTRVLRFCERIVLRRARRYRA
jgi:HAD superfamily phosphatase (TIGR01668 family)